MQADNNREIEARLLARREELAERLARIRQNLRRGLSADSAERAKELEDSAVVDALGNDASGELMLIHATLERLRDGSYDECASCGDSIGSDRHAANPYASNCFECALNEERQRKSG